MASEGECAAPLLSPGQAPPPVDRTAAPLDRESAPHREEFEQSVSVFRPHLRSNPMPNLDTRVLVAMQVALIQRVADRGNQVDPEHPTEHMLASEKREFDKRRHEIRAAQSAVRSATLSTQAAQLRLLEISED